MSDHQRLEELAELYPLGGLGPEEQTLVDRHLASGCDRCERLLLESMRVSGHLLDAVRPMPVAPEVKEQLLERIRTSAPRSVADIETDESNLVSMAVASPHVTPSRVWLPLAAVLALLAVGLGLYAQSLRTTTDQLAAALAGEGEARRNAEMRLEALESRLAALTRPDAWAVSLTGQGNSAAARARAFVDPVERRVLLYVYDLLPLPPGQTYQLWVIINGTPVSAGTFDVETDGSARYDADSIPALEPSQTVAVAVTVEPAGGVPQPTGAMALVES